MSSREVAKRKMENETRLWELHASDIRATTAGENDRSLSEEFA